MEKDIALYGTSLATLYVIGGLDDRPRIGGLVQHDELGLGTIVKIPTKSKAVVLFHGGRRGKLCAVSSLKSVNNTKFQLTFVYMVPWCNG